MSVEFEQIIKGEICPYCKCGTELVSGKIIYPEKKNLKPAPSYLDNMFYQCKINSDHYVGTYNDQLTSLGRLADKELRKLKNKGHTIFDPLWRENNYFKNKTAAYRWLSEKMNLPFKYTHFGMFTIEQCNAAIKFCEEIINNQKH
jgi:hypothetical protein